MARRSSKPEEEKDAGKPVEQTESMPSDPDFEDQTPVNEGRLFATEGSGAPSEMRQVSDEQLQAPKSPEFPVSDAMPDELKELKELDDADDWEEPEDKLDKADRDDEDEDDND